MHVGQMGLRSGFITVKQTKLFDCGSFDLLISPQNSNKKVAFDRPNFRSNVKKKLNSSRFL